MGHAIELALADVILATRQSARQVGRAGIARRFQEIAPDVDDRARRLDAVRARQVARDHALAVREQAALLSDEQDALSAALSATEYRLESIAATEAASAATAERLDAAREVAIAYGVELDKEWNAEGDACRVCAAADGDRVPLDDDFPNGLEPGMAHPRCRCWVEIIQTTRRKAA